MISMSSPTAARSASQIVGHRARKPLIRHPVQRMGFDRKIPARQLVIALRSRLDPLAAVTDGKVDRLVIAKLEMQAGMMLDRPPIAPVKRFASDEIQRSRQPGRPCRMARTSRMSSASVLEPLRRRNPASDRASPTCARRCPDRSARRRPNDQVRMSSPVKAPRSRRRSPEPSGALSGWPCACEMRGPTRKASKSAYPSFIQ